MTGIKIKVRIERKDKSKIKKIAKKVAKNKQIFLLTSVHCIFK